MLRLIARRSRARNAQSRWHCEQDGLYLFEPTGDTVYVSMTTNLSVRTDDAIRLQHDPQVVKDLKRCVHRSTSEAQLCTQGYCDGTSAATKTTC